MKIIHDCWESLAAHDCQYGAYIFTGSEFSIYVSNWLFVPNELVPIFSRFNEAGCVGHCVLRFLNVSLVSSEIMTYQRSGSEVSWSKPVISELSGVGAGGTLYDFSGSLKGFASSVDFRVDAGSFELHVLERDEPARE